MKKINIDRRKRQNKFNEASVMTVPWQKETTRNFKQLINYINSLSINKINDNGMKLIMSGAVNNATCIWQDLNTISKEFKLIGIEQGKHNCICGHHIEERWKIWHIPTKTEHIIGFDCINRIFPSLMHINMRKLINDLKDALDNDEFPLIVGSFEAYSELYYQVNTKARPAFVDHAHRNSMSFDENKDKVEATISIFMSHLLKFCGMKSYISKYNKLSNDREIIYRMYEDDRYYKKHGEHLYEEFENALHN